MRKLVWTVSIYRNTDKYLNGFSGILYVNDTEDVATRLSMLCVDGK